MDVITVFFVMSLKDPSGRRGKGTLESRMAVSVEQIFHLQEQCLQHALPEVMEQFTFVKECSELIHSMNYPHHHFLHRNA